MSVSNPRVRIASPTSSDGLSSHKEVVAICTHDAGRLEGEVVDGFRQVVGFDTLAGVRLDRDVETAPGGATTASLGGVVDGIG